MVRCTFKERCMSLEEVIIRRIEKSTLLKTMSGNL